MQKKLEIKREKGKIKSTPITLPSYIMTFTATSVTTFKSNLDHDMPLLYLKFFTGHNQPPNTLTRLYSTSHPGHYLPLACLSYSHFYHFPHIFSGAILNKLIFVSMPYSSILYWDTPGSGTFFYNANVTQLQIFIDLFLYWAPGGRKDIDL